MAANPKPVTATFDAPREHRSFRLFAPIIAVIEDIAKGVEAGEAGLKSCGAADISASCGVAKGDAAAMDRRDAVLIDDEDECFDAIGTYLANGFSHAEVAQMIRLSGGATHMLALERWCDRVRLTCNADFERESPMASLPWSGSGLHERRRRGHRAMTTLRATNEGIRHASVLHVVYGWPDPFVKALPIEVVAAMGRELVPLARYTDVVEERRIEMAHAEAAMQSRHDYDVVLSRADRCLSSGDALRAAAAPFNESNPPQHEAESRSAFESRKAEREERKRVHNERTDRFLLDVKLEADRMLKEASLAFQQAWFCAREGT